ncbi:30S ribosomal protein S12 methylthiotransferase RimO [bacterium]|nr:30S ribosomal protein S12 methylthiotransferase RimO [bacterium]
MASTKKTARSSRPLRVGIVTLGCDKNTVDNEYLAGLLDEAGCEIVTTRRDGDPPLDAVVVTTCGFIGDAREQSVDAIVQLAEDKRLRGNPRRLFVAGCLSQRCGEELMTEIPEIDGLAGVGQFEQLAKMILKTDGRATRSIAVNTPPRVEIDKLIRRRPLAPRPYAFLKIGDGCDHNCSFCSIPLIKGRLRSVPPEIALAEARALLKRGVREINLVAQDLSAWGLDRWPNWRLPRLVRQICKIPGDFWLRCLYVYPGPIADELIDVMASEPKVVPYLDMPLQHLDPDVLHRMKRPFLERNTFEMVGRLRAALPSLTLRTTMIVGFPGETAAAHRRLIDGIQSLRFDRLGAFEYSPESDTPASTMPLQVSPRTRRRRWHAVMATQAAIALQLNQARLGRTERVLIEGFDPQRKAYIGRSAAEAPEVDGKIYISSSRQLETGLFTDVHITKAEPYDLFAVAADGMATR